MKRILKNLLSLDLFSMIMICCDLSMCAYLIISSIFFIEWHGVGNIFMNILSILLGTGIGGLILTALWIKDTDKEEKQLEPGS